MAGLLCSSMGRTSKFFGLLFLHGGTVCQTTVPPENATSGVRGVGLAGPPAPESSRRSFPTPRPPEVDGRGADDEHVRSPPSALVGEGETPAPRV